MRIFILLLFFIFFAFSCKKKPKTGPDSDAYNSDRAFYESFQDSYTYADGSCVSGCEKVNGICVPKGDTFIAGYYGSDYAYVIPKSRSLPGQGASIYWKRNIDEIPDAFPQYFKFFHMEDRFSQNSTYTLAANYTEASTQVTEPLKSGYVRPAVFSTTGSPYAIFFRVSRSPEGDTFYTTTPIGHQAILPVKREINGKNLLGFIQGRFSPDFKRMSYYWDYYLYDIDKPIKDANLVFYKRTKRVTLDFH